MTVRVYAGISFNADAPDDIQKDLCKAIPDLEDRDDDTWWYLEYLAVGDSAEETSAALSEYVSIMCGRVKTAEYNGKHWLAYLKRL